MTADVGLLPTRDQTLLSNGVLLQKFLKHSSTHKFTHFRLSLFLSYELSTIVMNDDYGDMAPYESYEVICQRKKHSPNNDLEIMEKKCWNQVETYQHTFEHLKQQVDSLLPINYE